MTQQSQPPSLPGPRVVSGIGRIAALQPELSIDDALEPTATTQDPVILNNVTNLLHVWAQQRTDLPIDFSDSLRVVSVSRQPLIRILREVEHLGRGCREVSRPYHGETIDQSDWLTDDLQQMEPLPDSTFPAICTRTTSDLPGRQSIVACSDCSAEGTIECSECHAAGMVPCYLCGGEGRIVCDRCGGTGGRIGARGEENACQLCRSRGYLRCARCNGRQTVECRTCQGQRRLKCETCDGQQNLLRSWVLDTHVDVDRLSTHLLREAWPLDRAAVDDDLQLIDERQMADGVLTEAELKTFAPGDLGAEVARLLAALSYTPPGLAPATETMVHGTRVRVLGTYAYEINFENAASAGRVYVAGRTCRVFPAFLPQRGNAVSRFCERIKRLARSLVSEKHSSVDHNFARAVAERQVHISDSASIGPGLAASLGAPLQVTDAGYALAIRPRKNIELAIQIIFDADDEGNLLWRTEHLLGPARRELFPRTLAQSHSWLIGRLGITEESPEAPSHFVAIDVRLYNSVQPEEYTMMLKEFAEQIVDLRELLGES